MAADLQSLMGVCTIFCLSLLPLTVQPTDKLLARDRSPKEGNDLDVAPLDEPVSAAHRGPVLVDIGGNTGQQAARLAARHPELAGRVVVQNGEETIGSAPAVKGVQLRKAWSGLLSHYTCYIHTWTVGPVGHILWLRSRAKNAGSPVGLGKSDCH